MDVSVSTQARPKVLSDYLLNQPLDNTVDVAFVCQEIKFLAEKTAVVAKVRKDSI